MKCTLKSCKDEAEQGIYCFRCEDLVFEAQNEQMEEKRELKRDEE